MIAAILVAEHRRKIFKGDARTVAVLAEETVRIWHADGATPVITVGAVVGTDVRPGNVMDQDALAAAEKTRAYLLDVYRELVMEKSAMMKQGTWRSDE